MSTPHLVVEGPKIALSTAASRSASSNTRLGLLPPHSNQTCLALESAA